MPVMRAGLVVLCLLVFFAVVLSVGPVCRPGSRTARALDRALCRTLLRLLRVRVRVVGRPAPAGANRLVVANHVSWLDTLVVGSVEPVCFLAKREVGCWPVVSTFARLQDTVFVDRRRRRLLPQVNRTIAERLRAGRSVLVFPEGTTFDGSRRGRFLTSHLASLRDRLMLQPTLSACEVQPAALVYGDPIAAWVGDATLLPHVWTLLQRPGLACALVYGVPRAVERGFDRKLLGAELAADVERLVAAAPLCGGPPRPSTADLEGGGARDGVAVARNPAQAWSASSGMVGDGHRQSGLPRRPPAVRSDGRSFARARPDH